MAHPMFTGRIRDIFFPGRTTNHDERLVRLHHTTTPTAAAAILADGFRATTGSYGFVGITLTGDWFSWAQIVRSE